MGLEIIAKVIYAKIKKRHYSGELLDCLDLDTGMDFQVNGHKLIDKFVSADLFTKTEPMSKVALAEKFVAVGYLPFTVCFTKADGTDRVLRGRLVEHEDLLGRSMVRDFDVEHGQPLRQVDHRTLQYLTVDGVKYELK